MKILVTGGAGYCGVKLTQSLLSSGHHVTVVDDFRRGRESVLNVVGHSGFKAVCRDIRSSDRDYLKGQDVVFHLAAISGQHACEADHAEAHAVNVRATAELASALERSQILIFPSTTSFYGATGNVCDENSSPEPISHYGRTKWDAEQIVIQRSNSIVFRPTTAFGLSPRMRTELLINDFVENAVRQRSIALYGADSGRSFIHIDDLIRGYEFALNNVDSMVGGVFNIGNGSLNLTKRQVARSIQSVWACKIREMTAPSVDGRDFSVSFRKIEELGFRPIHSLHDGISQLVKWYGIRTAERFA